MARDIRGTQLWRAWITYTYEDWKTKEILESTVYFGPYAKRKTAKGVLTTARKEGYYAWQNQRSYGIDVLTPNWETDEYHDLFTD